MRRKAILLGFLWLLCLAVSVSAQEIKIVDPNGVARAIKRNAQSEEVVVEFSTSVRSATLRNADGRSIATHESGTRLSFSGVVSGIWQIFSEPADTKIKSVKIGR